MRSPCRKGTENHHGKTANAKSHRVQEEFIEEKRDKCTTFHSNISGKLNTYQHYYDTLPEKS